VSANLEVEQSFPHIVGKYKLTSPKDKSYNCVAWAVGDIKRFWDDIRIVGRRVKGYYWPDGCDVETIEGWKCVFELHGYKECGSEAFDPDFEKVAIYELDNGEPSHAARQMGSGKWSSKLGVSFDIEHETLDSLSDGEYGTVAVIMQRPCKDGKRVQLP
jgi:hypothetical protein